MNPEYVKVLIPAAATVIGAGLALVGVLVANRRKKPGDVPAPKVESLQNQSSSGVHVDRVTVGGDQTSVAGNYYAPSSPAICPNIAKLHYQTGLEWDELHDSCKALQHFKAAADGYLQLSLALWPGRADALVKEGINHYGLAEYQDAIDCYVEALAIYKQNLDHNQANIAWIYSNMGDIHCAQNEHEKSAIYKQNLDHNQANIAWIYSNMGDIHCAQNEHEKSLNLYAGAYYIFLGKFGPNHTSTKMCRKNMEKAYKKAKRPEPFDDWLAFQLSKPND